MSLTEPVSRLQLREERELRARAALAVKMLTAAGYAMIGGTFFKAIEEQRTVPPLSYVWAAVGLACLGFAIFFAPLGEPSDE